MASFYADNHLRHIAGLEKRFGPVSDEVATGFRSLVRVICQYENPVDAIPFLERCISIQQKLHGPQSALADLDAWITKAGGTDFQYIEPLQLQRLAIKADVFGEDSLEVAEECEDLAPRYAWQRDYPKAKALLERSLSIKEKIHGTVSLEVAETIDALVRTSARMEKWQDTEACLERSLHLKEILFEKGSEEIARYHLAAAIIYANASRLQSIGTKIERVRKAKAAFEPGLSILEKRFGRDSLEVQQALEAMIRAYVDCREFRKAEPLLKRLLSIYEQAYGNDAAAQLWILAELARGYAEDGSAETERTLNRGFKVLRTFLDAKSPVFRHDIQYLADNKEALYGRGILETLVQASEAFRRNLRKRWGAKG